MAEARVWPERSAWAHGRSGGSHPPLPGPPSSGRAALVLGNEHQVRRVSRRHAWRALSGFWELLSKIENNKRKVPVPRRVVRLLAHGAGRVVTATVLGHLLRCLYYRNGECKPLGNCKASWVADVFGVNASNVKAARKHLIEIGLFVLVEMPEEWHRNRWGARIGVNLQWRGASGGVEGQTRLQSDLRPPSELSTTDSRPPCLNQKPLPRGNTKTRNPPPAGRLVFSLGKGEGKSQQRNRASGTSSQKRPDRHGASSGASPASGREGPREAWRAGRRSCLLPSTL